MPAEERERHPFFPPCRICGREIHAPLKVIPTIIMSGLVFCPEHIREFQRRRRSGVSTAELDTRWGDTLRNWRERPSELDQEAKRKFLASSFALREGQESWLIFERSFYQFSFPRPNRSHKRIYNPRKNFWRSLRRQRSIPRFHRLSDYLAINRQTGEIRRLVDVTYNEVLDDLQGIHPAPAQAELAPVWGKRKPGWHFPLRSSRV